MPKTSATAPQRRGATPPAATRPAVARSATPSAAPGSGALRSERTAEAILDAARAAVLDFGVRRTTLSDIARRAGVGRMTVYKRFADVNAVMRALMTRELGALLEGIDAATRGPDARSRLVAALVRTYAELPAHPIFRKVTLAESELLTPYLVARIGGTQRLALRLIERRVADGQHDGSIRAGDVRAIAAAALLVEQSFIVSAPTIPRVSAKRMATELEHTLHAVLAPAAGALAATPRNRRTP